jgi:hypothetical protein
MRDMRNRGRGKGKHDNKGEKHPSVKLMETEVKAIRADRSQYKTIAAKYGVCIATIGHIKSGKNWKHLG